MPDSPTPVSEKQLAANRANAARSTGPRTPQGKARSARNAVKHGFTASSFNIVRFEDLQEMAHLKEDAVSVYQPVNAQEMFAIERIALAQQSILRAARLEAGIFSQCLNESLSPQDHPYVDLAPEMCRDIEITRQQNRNFLLAEGFHAFTKNHNGWNLFLRYQAQAERFYRRAIEEFERLKRLRPQLPNEPISECEPEEPQELYHRLDVWAATPIPPGDPSPPTEPDPPDDLAPDAAPSTDPPPDVAARDLTGAPSDSATPMEVRDTNRSIATVDPVHSNNAAGTCPGPPASPHLPVWVRHP